MRIISVHLHMWPKEKIHKLTAVKMPLVSSCLNITEKDFHIHPLCLFTFASIISVCSDKNHVS